MDQLLFEACSIAETYKYDRVEPEHVIFALLTSRNLIREQDLCGFDPNEVAITLESGFRYWRKHHGVDMPRLIISDHVMDALERAKEEQAPLLRILLTSIRARSEDQRQSAVFPDPLPDLDEILDAVEREQSSSGFDKICDDVFQKGWESDHQGPEMWAPGPALQEVEMKTEPRQDRSTGPSTEKLSLSSKERLEAKRAVERSIRDLTELFRSGRLDPVIGRDAEIDQICRILMRRRKSNVLLVGEPGVGKTALMEGVAARIATSPDPSLSRRPVLQASLGALVAGARYRGDFEIRMELLVEHALERQAVLFFDEMQMLIGSGTTAERGMDGANLLKPVLARDGMSLIGATTNEEAASIRADPALMRRFEAVMVNEPDPELMREILSGAASTYLTHHDLKADARTLERLIDFAERYLPDRRFPDKAFDLLDTACVQARLSGHRRLRVENIRFAVRQLGGTLPGGGLDPAEQKATSEKRMVERLAERVGGHPDALARLAALICSADPSRPVGAHLVGPSGVGRRTLAKALSRVLGGPFLELDAASGPDRIRGVIQSALRPGTRAVILVNISGGLDAPILDLFSGISSTGTMLSESGMQVDMNGAVILFRGGSERRQIGFIKGSIDDRFRISNIENIEMKPFEHDSLRRAVQFELERLSRIWSDSGVSRPIPDVDSVVCGIQGAVPTWAEVVELCRKSIFGQLGIG